MLQVTNKISGKILWANLHLLFWLSLVPFTTGWMGENYFAPMPSALYGFVLLMAAFAYWILQSSIIAEMGNDSIIAKAVGKDYKGKASLALYISAIPLSFVSVFISGGIYVLVAFIWLIPDKRIEKHIKQ